MRVKVRNRLYRVSCPAKRYYQLPNNFLHCRWRVWHCPSVHCTLFTWWWLWRQCGRQKVAHAAPRICHRSSPDLCWDHTCQVRSHNCGWVLDAVLYSNVSCVHACIWIIQDTYGSRGNVTMRSSYFANFTRSWLKVRLKLDRKLHKVRSKLAQTSYKVDLHVCTHFEQSGLKIRMQSFPAKFTSKWNHIFRACRIYLHEYCIVKDTVHVMCDILWQNWCFSKTHIGC